ncbi:hypothetical protein, partial [Shewanella algae]|uniref:hypothetical protein n=1 Tax=Shewanella algae TaxID=38313 RepID=UPI00313BD2AF
TTIIDRALENEQPDFEDNIQLECALLVKNIQSLITRNSKDFKTKNTQNSEKYITKTSAHNLANSRLKTTTIPLTI